MLAGYGGPSVRLLNNYELAVWEAQEMSTHREEIITGASPDDVWDAVRDVGALHTRLVPGFVVDTRLEPGGRVVTFANGFVVREPIVAIDEAARRLVWTSVGGAASHYNASLQVFATEGGGCRLIWIADFLPDEIASRIVGAMKAGAEEMRGHMDRLAAAR